MLTIEQPLILVVEDSKFILDLLDMLLTTNGFKFYRTDTAVEIENMVYQLSPDLILMDILLKDSNGCDACKLLKANEDMLHVPIILMSAHEDGAKDSKLAGADGFIAKPFEILDLINMVQSNLTSNFR